MERGFERPSVLDISAAALDRAKQRLGDRAGAVEWIVGSVTELELEAAFDVWHDRALFHFLTDAVDRRRYVRRLEHALVPHGRAVIATFGPEGPTRCSGLTVRRYDARGLEEELGTRFRLEHSEVVTHHTPRGAEQQFVYTIFSRRKS